MQSSINIAFISPHFVLMLHSVLAWYKLKGRKEKQRQAAPHGLPMCFLWLHRIIRAFEL